MTPGGSEAVCALCGGGPFSLLQAPPAASAALPVKEETKEPRCDPGSPGAANRVATSSSKYNELLSCTSCSVSMHRFCSGARIDQVRCSLRRRGAGLGPNQRWYDFRRTHLDRPSLPQPASQWQCWSCLGHVDISFRTGQRKRVRSSTVEPVALIQADPGKRLMATLPTDVYERHGVVRGRVSGGSHKKGASAVQPHGGPSAVGLTLFSETVAACESLTPMSPTAARAQSAKALTRRKEEIQARLDQVSVGRTKKVGMVLER